MTGRIWAGGITAAVAVALLTVASARADILIKSDGTPIEGKLLSQSATAIVFQAERDTAPQSFDRSAVTRVVGTDAHGAVIFDSSAATQPAVHWDVPAEPAAPAMAARAAGPTYYVIPLHGEVGVTVLASALDKSLADAVERKPTAVILDIDSPGGLVEEAKKIMEVIHRYNKQVRIIALANQDLSAAAILSLSCKEIYVKATGTIGAAVAFNPANLNLPPKLEEKMLSAWRAVARNSAEEGGHEPLLAEAMVDNSIELHLETVGGKPVVKEGPGDRTLCHKGRVLTLSSHEAAECGLAAGQADDFAAVGQALKMGNWTECQGLGVPLAAFLPQRAQAFKSDLDEVAAEFARDVTDAVNADPSRSTVTVINAGPRFAPRRLAPPAPRVPGMPRRIPGPVVPPPPAMPPVPRQAVTVVSSGSPATWKRDSLLCVLALNAAQADLGKARSLCEAFGFQGDAEEVNGIVSKVAAVRQQVYDGRNKYSTSGVEVASNSTPGATTRPAGDENIDVTVDGRTANGGSYHREIHIERHSTVTTSTDARPDTQKTAIVGGPGGGEFSKVSPTGGPVYGFRVAFGSWAGKQVLGTVEPLFDRPAASAAPPANTTQVVARDGFVVGGLIVNADKVNAFAFRVIFVGFSNGRVNPASTYTSDWIGKPASDLTQQLAGKGETIVGLCGHQGMNCDALGLVLMAPTVAAAQPQSPATASPGSSAAPVNTAALTQKTLLVGGPGGGEFSKVSPTGGPVYGLRVAFGSWAGKQVLGTVEPLFDPAASAAPPANTTQVVARDGFVVGGLIVNADKVAAMALRVIFVRSVNGRVDPASTYSSDWIGTPAGDITQQLAGKGETVVGLCGHRGMNCDAVGLVIAVPKAAPATRPAAPAEAAGAAPAGPNLLAQMVLPRDAQTSNGDVFLPTRGIRTASNIPVPFRADIVAKTDSTNIRLGYGRQGLVIFNWELKPDTLRYHDPVKGFAGIVSLDGKGSVPVNEFVHITWIMTETGSRILVNGEERASIQGDYRNVSEPLSVLPANGSHITVRSVSITPVK